MEYVGTMILLAISVFMGVMGTYIVAALLLTNRRVMKWFMKKYVPITMEITDEMTKDFIEKTTENQSEC